MGLLPGGGLGLGSGSGSPSLRERQAGTTGMQTRTLLRGTTCVCPSVCQEVHSRMRSGGLYITSCGRWARRMRPSTSGKASIGITLTAGADGQCLARVAHAADAATRPQSGQLPGVWPRHCHHQDDRLHGQLWPCDGHGGDTGLLLAVGAEGHSLGPLWVGRHGAGTNAHSG